MTTEQRLLWGTFVGLIVALAAVLGSIFSGPDAEDRHIFVIAHPLSEGGCHVTTLPQQVTVWSIDDVTWSLLNLCNADDDLFVEAFKDSLGNAADPMAFESPKKKKQRGKAKNKDTTGYFKYTVRVGIKPCDAGGLCEDPEIEIKKH